MRDCERLGLDQVVTPGPVTMPHLVCEHLPQEAVSALITAGAGMGRDSQETKQGKKKKKKGKPMDSRSKVAMSNFA